MAGGMDLGTTGRGGRKPLDTPINLVPFIDLMAVTISFLIMTAVWTQIGRLQVSQTGGANEDPKATENPPMPLTLLITERELRLTAGGSVLDPIPISRDGRQRLDLTRLQRKLKEIKDQVPEQSAITIQAEDTVRYEDLVQVIDECIGTGLQSVSVAAAMG